MLIGLLPGGGTFSNTYKLLSGGDNPVNQLIDEVDKNVRDIPYVFECPNCGYTWMSTESSGNVNREEQEKLAFQEIWGQFFENWDEVFASTDTINKFITANEEITDNMVSPLPKSEMYFMMAFCAYAATDLDRSYLNMSRKYNSRAIRTFNDQEYQLFARIISQKEQSQSVESIVSESIKIITDIDENVLLIKKDWYMGQLNDAINKVVDDYKNSKMDVLKHNLTKTSFILCIPIFLFFYYKWSIYIEPESFFAMHWNYWYILIMIIVGLCELSSIYTFYQNYSKERNVWVEECLSQYTSFKWSDLFK